MEIISRKEAKSLGLKNYFTGLPCKRGHFSERFVSCFGCKACLYEREKHKCANDPEYAKERQAARTARQAARMKRMKHDDEYYKWYCHDQTSRHRERLRVDPQYAKARYENSRKWLKDNPIAARAYASKRRALLSNSVDNYTPQDVVRLLTLQKNKCANCGVKILKNYHVDHIIALSKGGDNSRRNIQCLCPTCNVRKHNKNPIDWAQQNGRLL